MLCLHLLCKWIDAEFEMKRMCERVRLSVVIVDTLSIKHNFSQTRHIDKGASLEK